VFIRRQAVEEVGGIDRARNVCLDTDLFVRLTRIARPARIGRFLAALRFHADSQTSRRAAEIKQADEEIRQTYGLPRLPGLIRRLGYKAFDVRFNAYQELREFLCRDDEYAVGQTLAM
jgi:GT2 family glycosyltransferase